MTKTSILGKRKNGTDSVDGIETRKRRALRSTVNDENVDPEILHDENDSGDELAKPSTPSKRLSKAPVRAKSSSGSRRVALSEAKFIGHCKTSETTKEGCQESYLATPKTPRHRDALKTETPKQRIQATTKLPITPRTPRTPSGTATIYSAARRLFARSAAPGRLVGRDRERSVLVDFLEEGIKSRSGRCLYISGPPGTGKSAFVSQLCGEFSAFGDVKASYLNCMSIKSSKELVGSLVRELLGDEEDVGNNGLGVLKSTIFPTTKAGMVYILTLDEIDHLLTLDLEVLYTIFEWALNPSSRLILIGIANALDLTERFLPRLKSSNLQPRLLQFVPYTVSQIASVIISRLQTLSHDGTYTPFIHPAAIQFCAKKVASQTGDLRKAFDLIRRTIDLIEAETRTNMQSHSGALSEINNLSSPSAGSRGLNPDELVNLTPETAPRATISHVAKVAASAFNNGTAQRLKALNLQQKAALCSLLVLEKKNACIKRDLVLSTPSKSAIRAPTARNLFDLYSSMCKQDGKLAPLERNEFMDVIGSLEAMGLVRGVDAKVGLKGRKENRGIVSAVSEKEVESCLEGVVGSLLVGFLNCV